MNKLYTRLLQYACICICLLLNNCSIAFSQQKSDTSQAKLAQSFAQIKRDLNNALKSNNKMAAATCYEKIGGLFYYQAAYSQALGNYFKADKLFRGENAQLNVALNLNKIGETYYHGRQYKAAADVFLQSLDIFKALRNRQGIAQTYGFIGQTYEKTDAHNKAVKYQKLALHEYEEANDKSGLAKIYENLGSLHEDKLQLDTALTYFTRALELNKANNNRFAQIEVINNIGDVYRKSGRYKQSLIYTHQAASLAKELNDQYQLGSAYRDLSKAFNLLNRNDSAYYYSEAGRNIFLDIYTQDNEKQMALLQTLFEIEQKDNAITRFENEKIINRVIAVAAGVIAVLVALLGYAIISRQRLKIKNEQKLHEQNQHNLKGELELKSKELTSHTLHLIQKNQVLEELKNKLNAIVKDDKRDQRKELKQLVNLISINHNQDKNWEDFRSVFEQVHEDFFDSVKKHSASLNSSDMRLLALLKMNLSSADIATMLGISQDSLRISRYRLRKKLNLPEGENLGAFVQNL
ncbi:MAG: tetratricopeptide repeat protein [Sphingobacteriaceae bacterium]|nr:MAG: tetratricopeptide repeat protein [Sphingobacteriaceae bacterium]